MHEEQTDQTDTKDSVTSQTKKGASQISHIYFELPNDLWGKPNALCDLIELEGSPDCLVFCNSPSEADFVDVILKKRGIGARKLIGNVPPSRISTAIKEVKEREVRVLVLTDVSARTINTGDFELAVNYSVPSDPEVYLHRIAGAKEGSSLKKFISLVTPLDLTNFHYIKKFLEVEVIKANPPGPEEMRLVKFQNLKNAAKEKDYATENGLAGLTNLVLEDSDRERIVALLLHNSLNVLPSLSNNSSKDRHETEHEREDHDEYRDESSDYGRPRGGGRYGDRGYGDRDRRRSFSRNDDYNRGSYRDDSGFEPRDEEQFERTREARIYIGAGSKQGLSRDKIEDLLKQHCNLEKDAIKRLAIRKCYTFVDVDEGLSQDLIDKLSKLEFPDTANFIALKAMSINSKKENGSRPDNNESRDEPEERSADDDSGFNDNDQY